MNGKIRDLLILAMEECAEIQQCCSKSIRFGLKSHHPNREENNAENLVTEFYHLVAVIENLQELGELPRFSIDRIKYIKKDKMRRAKMWRDKNKNKG